jgi:hypothetical protein
LLAALITLLALLVTRVCATTPVVGTVSTLAGGLNFIAAGSSDGIGSSATFSSPEGVALGANGTIALIADLSNQLLRRIDVPTGTVTTVAGSATQSGSTDGIGSNALFFRPAAVGTDSSARVAVVVSRHLFKHAGSRVKLDRTPPPPPSPLHPFCSVIALTI